MLKAINYNCGSLFFLRANGIRKGGLNILNFPKNAQLNGAKAGIMALKARGKYILKKLTY